MNPLLLLGTIEALLIPVQRALAAVLPDFVEQQLDDPAVRQKIIEAADRALLASAPEARLIPPSLRQRIIGRSLGILLDDLLLPPS